MHVLTDPKPNLWEHHFNNLPFARVSMPSQQECIRFQSSKWVMLLMGFAYENEVFLSPLAQFWQRFLPKSKFIMFKH